MGVSVSKCACFQRTKPAEASLEKLLSSQHSIRRSPQTSPSPRWSPRSIALPQVSRPQSFSSTGESMYQHPPTPIADDISVPCPPSRIASLDVAEAERIAHMSLHSLYLAVADRTLNQAAPQASNSPHSLELSGDSSHEVSGETSPILRPLTPVDMSHPTVNQLGGGRLKKGEQGQDQEMTEMMRI
eukprot:GHVN01035954.1.p1 GENE.GHVN01035954.1~~GHVN01035954.1.p1  ORF type:complete len:186 (-),score=35.29 GHVN01035954.1:821-1378(-)